MTNKEKAIKIGAISLAITLIVSILSLIINIFSSIFNLFFEENTYKEITFSKVYDEIERIEIDGLSSFVTISIGNEFRVETTDDVKVNFKDKSLEIEEDKSWLKISNTNSKVVITIPEDTILGYLDIDTRAGKFIIDGIVVRDLDIDHGAGQLQINNSYTYKADIDGGVGEISIINTTLNNLDLDSGVGNVELKSIITGNSQVNCGVGKIDITLLGNEEDYSINLNKGIGSIKVDDKGIKTNTIYGSGPNKLKIDGGIGSIKVNFEEIT